MAKRASTLTMQYPAQVEVSRPELELSPSLEHLDVALLSKAANTEIEVGVIDSGCCRQTVRASIRKGKVTALYAETCGEAKPASPAMARLIQTARARLAGRGGPPKWKPVPVAEFLPNAARLSVDAWVCIKICIFGHCIMCCSHLTTRSFCMPAVIASSQAGA